MKRTVCFSIFLISLFALAVCPAGARTLDDSQRQRDDAPGKAVAPTNFDLVLQEKFVPGDAVDWQADEAVALSGGVLSTGLNVRTGSVFVAPARGAGVAKDDSRDRALNVADDVDGLPIIPQKDGGVISSLTGVLGLDWPMSDDDNQTITGTAVSMTQETGAEDIPELNWDFWLTPGAATRNPWPILGPLMAEGMVFIGLLMAIGAAWGISRHRQLMEP